MEKKELVTKLLDARKNSGKTYDELGEGLGLCNVYVAQLFHAQAQLKPESEAKLVQLVPGLSEDLVAEMRKCPMRSYDPTIIQEPNIYRMTEVCLHYVDSIKEVMRRGVEEGQFHKTLNVNAAAFTFLGMIQSTATIWALNGYSWSLDDWRNQILEIYKNGVAASVRVPA